MSVSGAVGRAMPKVLRPFAAAFAPTAIACWKASCSVITWSAGITKQDQVALLPAAASAASEGIPAAGVAPTGFEHDLRRTHRSGATSPR